MASILSLALETRLQIYQEALVTESCIDIYSGRAIYRPDLGVGLLYTCRKIYHEASDVFYEENTFTFHCSPMMYGLAFPHPQQYRMKKVEMELVFGAADPHPPEEAQLSADDTAYLLLSSYMLALARDVKVVVEGFNGPHAASLLQNPGPPPPPPLSDPIRKSSPPCPPKLEALTLLFVRIAGKSRDVATYQLTFILAPFLWLQGLQDVRMVDADNDLVCDYLVDHMKRPMLPHPILETVDERGDLRDMYHRSEDEQDDDDDANSDNDGDHDNDNDSDDDNDNDGDVEDFHDDATFSSACPDSLTAAFALSYGTFPDVALPGQNRSWKPSERGLKTRKSSFEQDDLARLPEPGTGIPGETSDEEDRGIPGGDGESE